MKSIIKRLNKHRNIKIQRRLAQSHSSLLEQLFEAGTALGEIDELNVLLDKVCHIGVVMGNCEGCSILQADNDKLHFLASLNTKVHKGITQFFSNYILDIDHDSIAGHCVLIREIISIDDVYSLPNGTPFSQNTYFDKKYNYRCKSMLVVPMLDTKKKVLGVMQFINHIGVNPVFPVELNRYMSVLATQVGIVLKNIQSTAELKRSRKETVLRFVKACESRDPETGGHIERIANYCVLLYEKYGCTEEQAEVIRLASMLHDVGKIAIPDSILKKLGRLTPEERLIMETHAYAGYEMLSGTESPMLETGAIIALSHHEKWDGTGYPKKLKETEIPLEGRIVALADVFDALSSKRCYKDAWTIDKVISVITEDSGKHFDPEIVKIFLDNINGILKIRETYSVEKTDLNEENLLKKAS